MFTFRCNSCWLLTHKGARLDIDNSLSFGFSCIIEFEAIPDDSWERHLSASPYSFRHPEQSSGFTTPSLLPSLNIFKDLSNARKTTMHMTTIKLLRLVL